MAYRPALLATVRLLNAPRKSSDGSFSVLSRPNCEKLSGGSQRSTPAALPRPGYLAGACSTKMVVGSCFRHSTFLNLVILQCDLAAPAKAERYNRSKATPPDESFQERRRQECERATNLVRSHFAGAHCVPFSESIPVTERHPAPVATENSAAPDAIAMAPIHEAHASPLAGGGRHGIDLAAHHGRPPSRTGRWQRTPQARFAAVADAAED